MTYHDMLITAICDPHHPAALYPVDRMPVDLDHLDVLTHDRGNSRDPSPVEIAAQCAALRAAYLARKRAAGRRFNDRRGPKVARLSGAGAAVLRGRAGGRGRWDGDDRGLIGVGEGGCWG